MSAVFAAAAPGSGFLVILGLTLGAGWLLSRYDTGLTGEDKARDLTRRALRCGATLALVCLGAGGGFILVAIAAPLALLWTGCLSEFLARAVHGLIDAEDHRALDPRAIPNQLDLLAALAAAGKYQEALTLCQSLTACGEVSSLAMEAMRERLYGLIFSQTNSGTRFATPDMSPSPGQAARQTDLLFKSLREQKPVNLMLAVSLMRIYARDLLCPARAYEIVDALEQARRTPPGFADFARASISEWVAAPLGQAGGGEEEAGIETLLAPNYPPPTSSTRR